MSEPALTYSKVEGRSSAPGALFSDVDPSPESHFALHGYCALLSLLRHIHEREQWGGLPAAEFLERHRVLGDYLVEIVGRLGGLGRWNEAIDTWRSELTRWESDAGCHLPLRSLQRSFELPPDSMSALLLAALAEEDSRFAAAVGELQQTDAGHPTVELVGALHSQQPGRAADGWPILLPLIKAAVVHCDAVAGVTRAGWRVRVRPELLDPLRGLAEEAPAPGLTLHPVSGLTPASNLILNDETQQRIDQLAGTSAAVDETGVGYVLLRGAHGTDSLEVAGALVRGWGTSLLEVGNGNQLAPATLQLLSPLTALLGATLVIAYPDAAPGTTVSPVDSRGFGAPVVLLLGPEGGLEEGFAQRCVTVNLPFPDAELRARLWQRALGTTKVDDLLAVSERFLLPSGVIKQTAQIALNASRLAGSKVTVEAVRLAAREVNRHQLDELAECLPSSGGWADLVVRDSTSAQLEQLELRCRHREKVLGDLGSAFSQAGNRGVRALFTGPSGTGKTLAAKILASALGMDVYRADLSAVINKYIGETEKNLHQLLARAESLDVVLLLDEGDSLLGGRTEVRSSNDRYANLETNFLLQRLEHYNGIVVVTTNLAQNIDRAFQRRMDAVVAFHAPGVIERVGILELHLPPGHTVSKELMLEVCERCDLSGGQLRNVSLQAALFALEAGRAVSDVELREALRSEFRKTGGFFPLDQTERELGSSSSYLGPSLDGMF